MVDFMVNVGKYTIVPWILWETNKLLEAKNNQRILFEDWMIIFPLAGSKKGVCFMEFKIRLVIHNAQIRHLALKFTLR